MSQTPGTAQQGPASGADGRSDLSVVTQFFLLPLAVVAGLVGIFLLFTLATRRASGPRDHLETLRHGRFNQRWQAAFELSDQLRDGKRVQEDPKLVEDLGRVFRDSRKEEQDDPRIRRYLALALGHCRSRKAAPALIEGARDPDDETRLYSLWGLAEARSPEAWPILLEALKDEDSSIRSIAAYGLGLLPIPQGINELRVALTDPIPQVRWNAALALGRRGDASGKEILVELLDRPYLDRHSSMRPEEKSATIINSLRALNYLKISGLDDKIRTMARSDPDPRVRQAAGSWGSGDRP